MLQMLEVAAESCRAADEAPQRQHDLFCLETAAELPMIRTSLDDIERTLFRLKSDVESRLKQRTVDHDFSNDVYQVEGQLYRADVRISLLMIFFSSS
ncbi:MAG: hypothetical protein QM765_09270 [Myxococcales bacterium]